MNRFELIDSIYRQVCDVILSRQHPITGLLPASTAVTVHGDYQDAWVRDNVYSIQCAWALALVCRQQGQIHRWDRLSQATIKLMRGLLQSMMHQADKVERFKHTQQRGDALHAKYNTSTGQTVVADDAWGHLQLDATSLFLLSLAQMTTTGLRIVMTRDEVDFVQNLVYYISTAYRTPDFGIWERGNKINDGKTEINASSLGMAKSALLAMDGLNLYGPNGAEEAVVHVIGDAISHARTALASLLPRESLSKEVDAALLSVIGYPAFAVGDPEKVERTRREILGKLGGRYGCKRFLLDGHQTAVEDTSRIHYEHSELVNFEHIESEWPLFFCYLYINAAFDGDQAKVKRYRERLDELMIEKDGFQLLPELYYVPRNLIEAEKAKPGSQDREPNENLPLVWAQSLYLVGRLLEDGLIDPDTLDAVKLRHRRTRLSDAQMAMVVLAENDSVKQTLAEFGVIAETPQEIAPCRIISAPYLVDVFAQVGSNEALGLSGRPRRSLQSLSTAQTYEINGERFLCLSWLQSRETDYRLRDPGLITELIRRELDYTLKHWFYPEVGVLTFMVTEEVAQSKGVKKLYEALRAIQLRTETTRVGYASARLALRASRSSRLTLDGLCVAPFFIRRSSTLEGALRDSEVGSADELQLRMRRLAREPMPQLIREGLEETPLAGRTERLRLYEHALRKGNWWLARYCFAQLGRHHPDVSEAITSLVARHITLVVGPEREKAMTIDADSHNERSFQRIESCLEDCVESVMVQEMLLILGALARTDPNLFEGVRTVETHNFMVALLPDEEKPDEIGGRELTDRLGTLSPGDFLKRIRELLARQRELYAEDVAMNFSVADDSRLLETRSLRSAGAMNTDWLEWRHARGLVPRFDDAFLMAIWKALSICPGIDFSDVSIKETYIDSERVRGSMTAGEESFAQLLDGVIGYVHPPYYRTASVEALMSIARVCEDHPGGRFVEILSVVSLLESAAELWARDQDQDQGQDRRERKLDSLLEESPQVVQRWLREALLQVMVKPDPVVTAELPE